MRKIFLLHIILFFSVLAWSQAPASGLPYECSFEESENLSAWVLNSGTPNAADQWMIGPGAHSEGKRALYITADGNDPNYNKKPNVVAAYLRYQFPQSTSEGHYSISFDWKGRGDSLHSRLYVMICPEVQLTTPNSGVELSSLVSETNGRLSPPPPQPKNYVTWPEDATIYTQQYICGSETWQNVTMEELKINPIYSSYTWAVVFLWENDNQVDSLNRTSIAIDNVQINSAALKKPRNVQAIPICEDSTIIVSWESELTEFEVQYREVGTSSWKRFSGISSDYETEGFERDGNQCSYTIKPVLEGSYDVRVRGLAGELTTSFVYKTLILVYCPDNHCINYLDLYGANVTCTYGHNPNRSSGGGTPYDNVGVIDFGPDSEESRHTIHVDPSETDPRTENLLHTVPEGALASVRLGNWKDMGEAESITYDVLVDSTYQGILIVQYAVVFENPPDHGEAEPKFDLTILDDQGRVIDPTCGHAEFNYTDAINSGWNETSDGGVAWKDWTMVGVNLMPYHGQHIKVRFTVMDCAWDGHYAYAYFTADCANAHIDTENCGSDARLVAKAPDGFAYEWRDETGTIVSNNQELSVDASKHTYTCRVSYIDKEGCYFEISTVSAPRFPVPEYTFEPIYTECTSKLKFSNTSHVMTKIEGEENHTSEPCSDYNWIFRRLSDGVKMETGAKSPTYTAPIAGDSIEVTYTCFIGSGEDNVCDSTRIDTIVVPNITSTPTEFHFVSCSEEPVKFGSDYYDTDTVVTDVFKNFAGCDSVSTLYLTILPKPEDKFLHDSICSDGSVTIGGRKYNQPCNNMLIMLKTEDGCDSALYLTLTVNERIQADVQYLPFACADDEVFYLNYDISAGVYDSLHIAFSTPELRDTTIYDPAVSSIAIPYPENITPGHYQAELTFYQFCCGRHVERRDIDVRYSSSIVEQKWNDVLTLLAPAYNGGFEFLDYQWFKNNEPLIGETHSYLYQPLDTTAEYYVVVTRKDSVQIATCPIQPVYHEQQSKFPTVVKAGQKMRMYMAQEITVWYYTVSGQLYSSFTLPKGHVTMDTPTIPGVYVLRAVDKQGETQAQVLLVE